METGNAKHTIHLIDLTADHYFGERQETRHLQPMSDTQRRRPGSALISVAEHAVMMILALVRIYL
jgi:hypothetical protein